MKTKKKRTSPKIEDYFSANSREDQRSDAAQSQIIRGDVEADHTQIIGGGDTVKLLNYWGDIYPPWVSAPLITTNPSAKLVICRFPEGHLFVYSTLSRAHKQLTTK